MQVSASRQDSAGSNRPDMRGRALPVPSGQPVQNGHSRNHSGLDMARSPPNPGNKSASDFYFPFIHIIVLSLHGNF